MGGRVWVCGPRESSAWKRERKTGGSKSSFFSVHAFFYRFDGKPDTEQIRKYKNAIDGSYFGGRKVLTSTLVETRNLPILNRENKILPFQVLFRFPFLARPHRELIDLARNQFPRGSS